MEPTPNTLRSATILLGSMVIAGAIATDVITATPAEIKQEADTKSQTIDAEIQAFQDSYFQKNGYYWQGLQTTGDKTLKPTNEVETWSDAGISLDPDTKYSTRVDVYDGPKGKGYVIVYSFMDGDTLWQKGINFGPEIERGYDWKPTLMKSI